MKSSLKNQTAHLAGIASALLGIWLLFVHGVLTPQHSFAVFIDNETFLGPVLSHMSATIRHGEWPVWMNTILGGVPLYNFTQLSASYPFYFAALPIFEGPLESIRSMHLITLAHLLLFEINAYYLLRVLRVSRVAALAGVVVIVFNANTLGYSTWINILAPYAWFPLYMAGLVQLLETPTSRRALLITLFAIVMLTLASPAQPLIHVIFVTGVFLVFYALRMYRQDDMGHFRRGVLTLAMLTAIAVLLLSPVLLPTVLDFGGMIRWVGDFPPVYGNARIPFDAFLTDQLAVRDLVGVLFPLGGSQAIGSAFVGLIPIFLAIIALLKKPNSWIVWPLLFVLIYSLASSAGSNLGLAYLNYHLPLINKIREPTRFLVLAHFSVGILVAFGIDRVGKLVQDSHQLLRPNPRVLWAIGGVFLVGFILVVASQQKPSEHLVVVAPVLALLIMLAITAIVITRKWAAKGAIIVASWTIAVIAMQWFSVPWVAPTLSASDYLSDRRMVGLDIALARVAEKDLGREYRVIFDGKIDKQRAAMLASYHGLRTLNAYFNPAPRQQFEELYYHGSRKGNYFRTLGAKYLICMDCETDAMVGYKHVEDLAGYSIYESDSVLPHWYVSNAITGEFNSLADFATKIATQDLSLLPLFVEPGAWQAAERSDLDKPYECNQKLIRHQLNRWEMAIDCAFPGILVLNEFFTTAWQVSVDGKRQGTLKVNGSQIGTSFPKGAHVIEFRYSPRILQLSFGLMAAGILMLLAILYFKRCKALK